MPYHPHAHGTAGLRLLNVIELASGGVSGDTASTDPVRLGCKEPIGRGVLRSQG